MLRHFVLAAVIAAVSSVSAHAGEEYMPLHPGNVPPAGGAPSAPVRRFSSADSGSASQEGQPKLHRNLVRLQLPSLGAKAETRPVLVGAQHSNLDGSLEFDSVRPMEIPAVMKSDFDDATDIPGLIAPEILAMDKYDLSEQARRKGGTSSGFDDGIESVGSAFPKSSYTAVVLGSPAAVSETFDVSQPSLVSLPAPLTASATPAAFEPEPAPAIVRPSAKPAAASLRPPADFTARRELEKPVAGEEVLAAIPAVATEPAPDAVLYPVAVQTPILPKPTAARQTVEERPGRVALESVPASGAVLPGKGERRFVSRSRRVAPFPRAKTMNKPAADAGTEASMRGLNDVLTPIYSQE